MFILVHFPGKSPPSRGVCSRGDVFVSRRVGTPTVMVRPFPKRTDSRLEGIYNVLDITHLNLLCLQVPIKS